MPINIPKYALPFIALSMLSGPIPVYAEDTSDLQRLLQQGYLWIHKGNQSQASNALNKALRLDPQNPEAIQALAAVAADQVDSEKLALARQQASETRYSSATGTYMEAFGSATPPLSLATEFYETMAATPAGAAEAKAGLEGLLLRYPNDIRLSLSLAKLRTYSASERRQGISDLESLADTADIHDEAMAAWKQALLWLEGNQNDAARYEAFLQRVPLDKEVSAAATAVKRSSAGNSGTGWQQYERGQRAQAEATFTAILSADKDNLDALTGLGLLRLDQARYGDAHRLLLRVVELEPGKQDTLQSAMTEAHYRELVQRSDQARDRGHNSSALKLIRQAAAIFPDRIETVERRAIIEADQGNIDTATNLYRKVVRASPDNAGARRALVSLLLEQGDEDQAQALVSEGGLSQEKFAKDRDRIRARRLRSEATELTRQGDRETAIQKLIRASQLDAENIWVRHDLGRLYIAEDRATDAYRLIDEWLETSPDDAEALYVRALLNGAANAPFDGLMTLERIEPPKRNQTQQQLQHDLWRRYQLSRVAELQQRGDHESAVALARHIQQSANQQPDALMVYAQALAIIGNNDAAFDAARSALAADPAPGVNLLLQYATVLLQARKELPLRATLERLANSKDQFNIDQQQTFDQISAGLAIQQAHALRKQGDLAGAYEMLRPWLGQFPNDQDLMLTMAALYSDAGDNARAQSLYQQVIDTGPATLAAWEGAAGAAMSTSDYDDARNYIDLGLEKNPDASDLLALRGIVESLSGSRTAAQRDLRRALESWESRSAGSTGNLFPLDVVSGETLRLVSNQANAETLYPFAPWEKQQRAKRNEPEWVGQVRTELARLEDNINESVYGGLKLRNHSGQSGLDDLTSVSMPVGYVKRSHPDRAWGAEVALRSDDAGDLPGSATYLGSGAFGSDVNADTQQQGGLSLALWMERGEWTFDIDSTPLGVAQVNVLGGIDWQFRESGRQLNVGVERRAVEDSVLSFSGSEDPLTGDTFGGVTDNALYFGVSQDRGRFGMYADLKLSGLQGEQVESNSAADVAFGLYWKTRRSADEALTIGSRLHLMTYDKNLRYYTLGHGGYFSPQQYAAITFPLQYHARSGALRYSLGADMGLYHFSEDGAPLYPGSSASQATIEATQGLPADFSSYYASNQDTGFAFNVEAAVDYNLSARLSLHAELAGSNARDYTDTRAVGYLRYYFNERQSVTPNLQPPRKSAFRLTGDEP